MFTSWEEKFPAPLNFCASYTRPPSLHSAEEHPWSCIFDVYLWEWWLLAVTEINCGVLENIQKTAHAQEPRASIYK